MSTILEVKAVTRAFGGLTAVDDVTLGVREGEIFGLIGPNGAGKTTLFNVVSGVLRPTRGHVFFAGEEVTGLSMHAVARRGLVRTFQLSRLFRGFTVLENVLVGLHLVADTGLARELMHGLTAPRADEEVEARAHEILSLVGLEGRDSELAGSLPHGLQRVLQIAVSLGAAPKMLLLDEPVTGMNHLEVEHVLALIRRLRQERGVTVVLVEHNMRAVMGVCDRVGVLHFGRKIAEGTPEAVAANEEVIRAYLGVFNESS